MSELEEYDEYESLPNTATATTHMIAGSLAGILEHCVMYPVDSVKVIYFLFKLSILYFHQILPKFYCVDSFISEHSLWSWRDFLEFFCSYCDFELF